MGRKHSRTGNGSREDGGHMPPLLTGEIARTVLLDKKELVAAQPDSEPDGVSLVERISRRLELGAAITASMSTHGQVRACGVAPESPLLAPRGTLQGTSSQVFLGLCSDLLGAHMGMPR
jgi:hypothetical protein